MISEHTGVGTEDRFIVRDDGDVFISQSLDFGAYHATDKIVMYNGGNEKIGTAANTLVFTADNFDFRDTDGHDNLQVGSGEVVVNEDSQDVDFRVESNGQTHMIFADGGNNYVGIATSAPYERFYVNCEDVNSPGIVSNPAATNGAIAYAIGYGDANRDYINTWGMSYSAGATVFGYGVKPHSGSDETFVNSADNSNFTRGALYFDNELKFFNAGAVQGTIDTTISMTERFKVDASGNAHIGAILYADDIYGVTNGTNRLSLDDDTNSEVANGVSLTGVNHIYLCPDETNNGTGEVRVIKGTDNDLDSGTATELFRITNTGKVGITEDSIDANLHITGAPTVIKMERAGVRAMRFGIPDNSGKFIFADADDLKSSIAMEIDSSRDVKIVESVGIGVAANGTAGRLDCSNDVVAFSTSDERLKENIKPLDNALDKVLKISGVSFDWKPLTEKEKETIHGNQGQDVGVIAQEVEEVLPEVVTTRDSGYKAVKYEKIVPLLIESIKELKQEIEELKKQ